MVLSYFDTINADTSQEPVRIFPTLEEIWDNHRVLCNFFGRKLMTDSLSSNLKKTQNM